ncbi:MAG: toll/interleukin-1 receptor domain-containing protein [Ilumatobacteraceae bacterium]
MTHIPDDKFRVFISHKHEDHELATTVDKALRSVSSSVECFVSGANIGAGTDWNREIRESLKRSHLVVLLFTNPTQNWDWCLYEAGLFTRLDEEDVHAVVSLFHPEGSAPRVLQNLQGVPAGQSQLREFLESLCKSTWRVSDDWRKGPLNSRVRPEVLQAAAAQIEDAFPPSRSHATHHPCHRLLLDLSTASASSDGIPDDALVVEGPGATETYTLSLFQVASGERSRTWGELIAALDGADAPWRRQLDRRFAAALRGELFAPTTATLRAFALEQRQRRHYRPIIYEILRAPVSTRAGLAPAARLPLAVTIVLDPQVAPAQTAGPALNLVRIHARFAAEVFDVYSGTVVRRSGPGSDIFNEVREAFQVVYEEADRYHVYELAELEHVFGDAYKASAIHDVLDDWDANLRQLETALVAQDATAVEVLLDQMRELNRRCSLAATRRYLLTLDTDHERHDVHGEPDSAN